MSPEAAERAERLRKLAERRTRTATTTIDSWSSIPVERNKRGHAAPAGRMIAAGVSAGAFFAGVAGFALNQPTWLTTTATTTTAPLVPATEPPVPPMEPPTTIVVEEVHHLVYVDQYGHPIDASAVPGGAPEAAAPVRTRAAAAPIAAAPDASAGAPAPAPAAAPPSTTAAPAPTPAPAPPPCSGSKCP
jgi:hypothetical protein